MRRLILLAPLVALAACAEKPFVDLPYAPLGYTIAKQPDQIRRTGRFSICYADRDADDVQPLADQTCGDYGLKARRISVVRYQCRLTAPHLATFACYDPEKRMPGGGYINPLNPKELEAWKKATGRKDDDVATPAPRTEVPTPAALGAPAPAPVPMEAPTTPPPVSTPPAATPSSAP